MTSGFDLAAFKTDCEAAMNDDFNTSILIANLFDAVKFINSVKAGSATISAHDFTELNRLYAALVGDVLGILPEAGSNGNDLTNELMATILKLRNEAKNRKDYGTSDFIRDELKGLNIVVKDTKEGAVWEMES